PCAREESHRRPPSLDASGITQDFLHIGSLGLMPDNAPCYEPGMFRILLGWSFVLVALLYPLPGFANNPDLVLSCDSAMAAMSGYLKLDDHGIENRTRAAQSLWTKSIGLLGTMESALL